MNRSWTTLRPALALLFLLVEVALLDTGSLTATAALYVVTSTTWSVVERAVLYR